MFDSHDAAVDDIIDSLYNNGEINDDGSATVNIHTYGNRKKRLTSADDIRKAMTSSNSLIVHSNGKHGDCQVIYDIIELVI